MSTSSRVSMPACLPPFRAASAMRGRRSPTVSGDFLADEENVHAVYGRDRIDVLDGLERLDLGEEQRLRRDVGQRRPVAERSDASRIAAPSMRRIQHGVKRQAGRLGRVDVRNHEAVRAPVERMLDLRMARLAKPHDLLCARRPHALKHPEQRIFRRARAVLGVDQNPVERVLAADFGHHRGAERKKRA